MKIKSLAVALFIFFIVACSDNEEADIQVVEEENECVFYLYCDGIYDYADARYDGEWRVFQENGFGSLEWETGEKYKGYFKDGLYDGDGTLTLSNGTKYAGRFHQNLKHGRFRVTSVSGEEEVRFYIRDVTVEKFCEDLGLTQDTSEYQICIFNTAIEVETS